MKVKKTFFAIFFVILFGLLLPHLGQADSLVSSRSKSCEQSFKETYILLEKGMNPYLMNSEECRIPHKLLEWLWLVKHSKQATLEDYRTFMRENGHWPLMNKIQEGGENTIRFSTDPSQILAFFKNVKPLTSQGMIHYVRALFATNQNTKAIQVLKNCWHQKNFSANNEIFFYDNFKKYITPDDHQKRFNRLAIEGNYYGLKRMMNYVSKRAQGIIQAAIALIQEQSVANFHLKKLAEQDRNTVGLLYQRVKWRMKKGNKDEALDLFFAADSRGHIDAFMADWFKYRNYFSRRLFDQKKYKESYAILKNHGLNPKMSEELSDYATAEWFLGWLSLRFLKKPSEAMRHFQNMSTYVQTPISKAKAYYWMGRTAVVLGNKEKAKHWYEKAAHFSHVFYGQEALKMLGKKVKVSLKEAPDDKELPPEDKELQIAADLLYHTNPRDIHLKSFLLHMAKQCSPGYEEHFMHWLHESGMRRWAVLCAKTAGRKGPILLKSSFPTHAFEPHVLKHPHLSSTFVHGLIRQESGFDREIKSPAGAAGMMQLMPTVAKNLCKQMNINYMAHKLTEDAHYNIRIGSFFLSSLMEKFSGHKVLALAAYNAGERPVKEWLKDYGDLRSANIDTLDWIESIPFSETRTYVMRIMESLPLYEARFKIS